MSAWLRFSVAEISNIWGGELSTHVYGEHIITLPHSDSTVARYTGTFLCAYVHLRGDGDYVKFTEGVGDILFA